MRGWLTHLDVERGLSRHTLAAYRRDSGRYLDHLVRSGVTRPEEIRESHVSGFLGALRTGDADHPPLAATSAARTLVAVRGLHRFLAIEGVTTDGRTLAELLRSEGIGAVDVVGIATDYCVRATALDAVREGLRVRLLGGMHAGVAPESSVAAVDEMRAAGVEVIDQ